MLELLVGMAIFKIAEVEGSWDCLVRGERKVPTALLMYVCAGTLSALTVKLSAHSLNSADHEKPPLLTYAPLLS